MCRYSSPRRGSRGSFPIRDGVETVERDLAKAENMIRLHSGGENALALRALRGGASGTLAGRGDARELLEELWRRA